MSSQGGTWRVVVLAGALAVGGCATVRQAREAQDDAKAPAGERTVTAAEAGLDTNTVLALSRAVELAVTGHPAVTQARQSLAAATAQVAQVRSALGPKVDAGAGYSQRSNHTEADRTGGGSDGSYSASLGLDLLVYDFGRTPAAIRQAVLGQVAAAAALDSALNEVTYNAAVAFFDLAKAQELRQVADEAVGQYRQHLEQVRAFVELGQRIRYDVTKAEVDLGNAQLSLIDASNSVNVARAVLNRSLGLAEEPGYRIGEAALADVGGGLEGWMAAARERHPDLRALQARARAASAAVDAAIADLYPSLSARADYAGSGRSFPLVFNWSAALQSVWQVFDSGRRQARIREAVANLRSARAAAATREQQIYLDLSRALSVRETARQRMQLTELILRQAGESLEMVKERYRQGKASSVEVTDAQVALTRARADQVQSHFEFLTAIAQIRFAQGGVQP